MQGAVAINQGVFVAVPAALVFEVSTLPNSVGHLTHLKICFLGGGKHWLERGRCQEGVSRPACVRAQGWLPIPSFVLG